MNIIYSKSVFCTFDCKNYVTEQNHQKISHRVAANIGFIHTLHKCTPSSYYVITGSLKMWADGRGGMRKPLFNFARW